MNNAIAVLENIYSEGEIDWVSFAQILGEVSYSDCNESFAKNDRDRILDALLLTEFLCASGDFEIGTLFTERGNTYFRKFPGTGKSFRNLIESMASERGLDDPDLNFQFWLNKVYPGKRAPPPSEKILKLFQYA